MADARPSSHNPEGENHHSSLAMSLPDQPCTSTEADSVPPSSPPNVRVTEDALKCAICIDIMQRPVHALPCLHTFCSGCARKWSEQHATCSLCRHPVSSLVPSRFLRPLCDDFFNKYPDRRRASPSPSPPIRRYDRGTLGRQRTVNRDGYGSPHNWMQLLRNDDDDEDSDDEFHGIGRRDPFLMQNAARIQQRQNRQNAFAASIGQEEIDRVENEEGRDAVEVPDLYIPILRGSERREMAQALLNDADGNPPRRFNAHRYLSEVERERRLVRRREMIRQEVSQLRGGNEIIRVTAELAASAHNDSPRARMARAERALDEHLERQRLAEEQGIDEEQQRWLDAELEAWRMETHAEIGLRMAQEAADREQARQAEEEEQAEREAHEQRRREEEEQDELVREREREEEEKRRLEREQAVVELNQHRVAAVLEEEPMEE